MKTIKELANEVADLVEQKNAAYGSAFAECGKILEVLFPKGIPPEKLKDALLMTRMLDKFFRIANNKDAFGEEPWMDLAGYSLLGMQSNQPKEVAPEPAFCLDCGTKIESPGFHFCLKKLDLSSLRGYCQGCLAADYGLEEGAPKQVHTCTPILKNGY